MTNNVPAFAQDLLEALTTGLASQIPPGLTPAMIPMVQANVPALTAEMVTHGRDIVHSERLVPGPDGAPPLQVTVFRRAQSAGSGPGVLFLHGGGMIGGHRLGGVDCLLGLVEDLDAVVVAADYRLAPQHPDPAPVEDAFAGLRWMAAHADELGFDAGRLAVAGISAGAGLAAGAALLARDRGGPALAAQVLICPMLDDRNESASAVQMTGVGVWDRTSNETGWRALLGERQGGPDVSVYAAPARAAGAPGGLAGLPASWLDVGSAETFRDEVVAYAAALWTAGVHAELHVTAGGFHGFEFLAAGTPSALRVAVARTAWLTGVLAATPTPELPAPTAQPTQKETAMSFDGTWNVIMHSPQGDQPLTLELASDGTALSGKAVSPEGTQELGSPVLTDGTATWKLPITKPMKLTLEFSATVDGDAISGIAKVGSFAKIPFDGTRA